MDKIEEAIKSVKEELEKEKSMRKELEEELKAARENAQALAGNKGEEESSNLRKQAEYVERKLEEQKEMDMSMEKIKVDIERSMGELRRAEERWIFENEKIKALTKNYYKKRKEWTMTAAETRLLLNRDLNMSKKDKKKRDVLVKKMAEEIEESFEKEIPKPIFLLMPKEGCHNFAGIIKAERGGKRKYEEMMAEAEEAAPGRIINPTKEFLFRVEQKLFRWLKGFEEWYSNEGCKRNGVNASPWCKTAIRYMADGENKNMKMDKFIRGMPKLYSNNIETFANPELPLSHYHNLERSVTFLLKHYKGSINFFEAWKPAKQMAEYVLARNPTITFSAPH